MSMNLVFFTFRVNLSAVSYATVEICGESPPPLLEN